ncbi:MAG: hypothetical protein WDO72_10205 [Pseudomonadota bacterium]
MRTQLHIAGAFSLFAGLAGASDASFTGYARSLDGRDLLYVESHSISGGGSADETRVVLYRCAVGLAPFARKDLDYTDERIAPAFAFEDARSGFSEGLRRNAVGMEVFARAGSAAKMRSEVLPPVPLMVADAGFDEFVRTRWDLLEKGGSIEVPFLVPSRLHSVNFKVRKVADATIGGDVASVFRLSVAGPLGWFLSDIDVSYRQRDRRLVRYRGITNVRNVSGSMLEAQIDFPDADRSDATVDLSALRALPLVSACR